MPNGMRILVASDSHLDTRSLADALLLLGHQPFVLSDVAELGTRFSEALRSAIRSADLVILLIGKHRPESGLYEAGIASALRVPVVVVALDGAVPAQPLKELSVIRTLDSDLLNSALTGALSRRPDDVSPPRERALGDAVDDIMRAVRSGTEAEGIKALATAVERSGAIAVSSGQRQGFDLAVWSDDLASFGANPLLVEFVSAVTELTLERVARSLSGSLGSNLAIVVFRKDSPSRRQAEDAASRGYPVIFVSVMDLLGQMREKSFSRVIRDLRNKSVHGR